MKMILFQFEYANGNTGIPNTWFQFLIQNVSNVNIFLPDLNYKHNASGRIRNQKLNSNFL